MPKHVPPWVTTVLPHIRISWGGTLGNPAEEVWTNSLHWMAKSGGDLDTIHSDGLAGLQANNAGLSTAIANWFQLPAPTQPGAVKASLISPAASLTWMKLNFINALGKYEFQSNTFFYPVPVPGGGAHLYTGGNDQPYQPPWQMSTAITLRTTNPRGRGSHGRIYPPMSGSIGDANSPYIGDVESALMTSAFTGLIDNINSGLFMTSQGAGTGYVDQGNAFDKPGNVCVVSVMPHTGPNAGAAPLLTPVYSVEVDQVPDVQTNRVNKVRRLIRPRQLVTLNI